MNFLASLLDSVLEGTSPSRQFNFLCIATTNPVYLAFETNARNPAYVIKRLNSKSARDAWLVQQKLYRLLPTLIAEPLSPVNEQSARFSIERGVAGAPWFQVKHHFSGEAWQQLIHRAIDSLSNLHAAIASVPEWREQIDAADILEHAKEAYAAAGSGFTAEMQFFCEQQLDLLRCAGPIHCIKQHGDFCLNNLLVAEHSLTIIDFEDFGITMMPLYDEFNLALTLLSDGVVSTDVKQLFAKCTAPGLKHYQLQPQWMPGLFFCFLLLKLGPWSLPAKRQGHRAWLTKLLADFINQPEKYFELDEN